MRAEYNAFLARLRAHTMLANKTDTVVRLDGSGNAVRANYIIAFPAVPDRLGDDRYTAMQDVDSDRFLSFDVRVVAVDADGVLLLAEAVLSQTVKHVLVVDGRRCEPMRLATGDVEEASVQFDKTARLFYLTLSLEFWSRRA